MAIVTVLIGRQIDVLDRAAIVTNLHDTLRQGLVE